MKDLTIILPIIELDDSNKLRYKAALESVKGQNIIVVGSAEAIKSAEQDVCPVVYLTNNGNTEYAGQVNFAVRNVKTKYFTVLEYDDTFSSKWFGNVEKYIESDVNETFGYLPLTEVIDDETKNIIGYANEAFWASSFCEEIGCLDLGSIDGYLNFNTSGAIFRTEDFISVGGLKESMKLVFWYEFLMRALYKEKRIYVIPKVGYFHTVNRKDSMTDIYEKTMSEKEAEWWIDLSKKEYYFPQDRQKKYEE